MTSQWLETKETNNEHRLSLRWITNDEKLKEQMNKLR